MKKFALLFAFAFFVCGANAYKIKKTEEGKPLQGKRAIIIDNTGKVLSGGATQQASPAASAPQNAAKGLSGGGASAAEAAKQTTAAMSESQKGPVAQQAQQDFNKKSKDIKDKLESEKKNQTKKK